MSESSAKARQQAVESAVSGGAFGGGAVVVTSYGMVSANPSSFVPTLAGQKWDYVVLDEGHKIKNASTRCVAGGVPT